MSNDNSRNGYSLQDLADIGVEIKTTKYGATIEELPEDQYETLKESIAENGLYHAITINQNGDVLDGHHRYRACQELGFPPAFDVKTFDSEVDERIFVKETNVARRHMSQLAKARHLLDLKSDYAEKAKLNMSTGAREPGKVSRNQETLHVDEKLAKMGNISKDTFYKAEKLLEAERENPEQYGRLIQQVEAQRVSINKAYGKIKRAQARTKAQERLAKEAEELDAVLPDSVTILNRDSTKPEQVAEIPDNSVDLIISDPPYTADKLHLFEGLADFAARKLKPGGSVVFYYGQFQQPKVHRIFDKHEGTLKWFWPITVHHNGHLAKLHGFGIWPECKPMMWYTKHEESRLVSYHHTDMRDFIESTPPDKNKHPWAQSPTEATYLIENLTLNGDALVVDPFLGSGAFGIAAAKLGRHFVGIEIDQATAERAKANIAEALKDKEQKEKQKEGLPTTWAA